MLLWVFGGLLMSECVPFAESTRQLMLRFLKLARRLLDYCISLFWSSALAARRRRLFYCSGNAAPTCASSTVICALLRTAATPSFSSRKLEWCHSEYRDNSSSSGGIYAQVLCLLWQTRWCSVATLLPCHASSPTCLFKSSPLTTIQARWSSLFTRPNAPSLAEPQLVFFFATKNV